MTKLKQEALASCHISYSGHLKARSTVARLVGKSAEWDSKAQDAADLLFAAGSLLLQKGQQGSGTDLALYLVEVWTQKGVQCQDQQRSVSAWRLRPSL